MPAVAEPLVCSEPHTLKEGVTCQGPQGHAGRHWHHGQDVSTWWTDDTR